MHNQPEDRNLPLYQSVLVLVAGVMLGLGLAWLWVHNKPTTASAQPEVHVSDVILYLSPNGGGAQLWLYDLDQELHQQLTHLEGQITGYDVAPDGSVVVFAVRSTDLSTSLWRYEFLDNETIRLLDCGEDVCRTPTVSTTGVIAFSRQVEAAGQSQIWLLNIPQDESETALQLVGEGRSPAWSPDGNKLAVLDDTTAVIRVLNMTNDREELIPTAMGVMGTWAPDGEALIFLDLLMSYEPIGRLYQVDFTTGQITLIDPQGYEEADFSVPAWSPDGSRLAVGVRRSGEGLGRKLVLLGTAGEDLQIVADDVSYVYGGANWNPEGDRLVFQGFSLDDPDGPPVVMMWNEETGIETIAERGFLPAWRP